MSKSKKKEAGSLSPQEQWKLRWRKQRIPGVCRLRGCPHLAPGKSRYCPPHQKELLILVNRAGAETHRRNLANGVIAKMYRDEAGMPTDYAILHARNAVRLLRAGALQPIPAKGPEAQAYLEVLAKAATLQEATE